jgi:hypothetical protein
MALRVLLLTPQFYDIEKTVKSVLEDTGFEVVWIENKTLLFDYHGTWSKFKFLRRLYFMLCSPRERYLKRALRKIGDLRFDILFSINGHTVCPFLFRKLKISNPDLYSVLYLWDSFSMYNWLNEIHLFNKVYSFDPQDCSRHKIAYKPVFYIQKSPKTSNSTSYDLFFVGKFSSERLSILDKVMLKGSGPGLRCFVKLWPAYRILFHNYFVYIILRTFNIKTPAIKKYILNFEAVEGKIEREYIIQESIDYGEVQERLLDSNVVLDLPYPSQTGYTHRLIEALANGKKLLTTNSNIRNEIFYNPEQIHILDDEDPEVDINWIKNISEFAVDNSFLNLELSNWLKSIFNVRIS